MKSLAKGLLLIVLTAFLLFMGLSGRSSDATADARAPGVTKVGSGSEFHDAMRRLWEDHIWWTRLVIVGVADDLPGLTPTVERLLENQDDIGNAVKPFYGEEGGNQLSALLREHIMIAAEILFAAKAGDDAALQDAIERWYANADDIAAFLNAANPRNWPLDEMQAMLRAHLDLTLAEATAELTGNYQESIDAFENVHTQALGMADTLSGGIIRQFPQNFRGPLPR